MNGTGRACRTLARDGGRPAGVTDPGDHAERGGAGQAHASGGHGEPTAPAEPPAPDHDRIDIQPRPGRLLDAGLLDAGLLDAGLLDPKRPPERVKVGHGSVTAHSWVSAATRSLASARELVLFTVPRVMPRSRATVASGRSNR
jgi:hypothetical protein